MNLEKFNDRAKGFQSAQTVAIRMIDQQIAPERPAQPCIHGQSTLP